MDPSVLKKIGEINNTCTSNPELTLRNVLRVSGEMLVDRGFALTYTAASIADLLARMGNSDAIIEAYREEEGATKCVLVFFHNEDRVGIKQLRMWRERDADAKLIIVSTEGPTAFTRKEADGNDGNVEFFNFKQLCVNITRHRLVPRHQKVSADQVPYDIRGEEWPKLYTNDAVASYYAFRPGDIIRVTRTIGYPEPVVYYRKVCVAPNA